MSSPTESNSSSVCGGEGRGELSSLVSSPSMTIDTVMTTVGVFIFSFLPLGTLLVPQSSQDDGSLLLVSKLWRERVLQSLSQRQTLKFSSVSQLRNRLVDESFRRILFAASASITAAATSCSSASTSNDSIQNYNQPLTHVQFVDLNRCHKLRGNHIHFFRLLLSMFPNMRRLALPGSIRNLGKLSTTTEPSHLLGKTQTDSPNKEDKNKTLPEVMSHIQALDFIGCRRINNQRLTTVLNVLGDGSKCIQHLDVTGCSTTITDEALFRIADCCPLLETVGLGGLGHITEIGVGRIAYKCRKTLRGLSLRGCHGVTLLYLLCPTLLRMTSLCREFIARRGQISLSSSLEERRSYWWLVDRTTTMFPNLPSPYSPSGVGGEQYSWNQERYVRDFLLVMDSTAAKLSQKLSIQNSARYKRREIIMIDSRNMDDSDASGVALNTYNNGGEGGGDGESTAVDIFSQLETLDMGLMDEGRNIAVHGGCLAAIAWLSGGRLRDVSVAGLRDLEDADLLMLADTSISTLTSLDATCCYKITSLSMDLLNSTPNLTHLSLPCCEYVGGTAIGTAIRRSHGGNLLSLKLDHIANGVDNSVIQSISIYCPRLLLLSIVGCSLVTTDCIASHLPKLINLRELDGRDCRETKPWSELPPLFPKLIKFNNRRTRLGSSLFHHGLTAEKQRVGDVVCDLGKTRKRKRQERTNGDDTDNLTTASGFLKDQHFVADRCSLSWSGQDKFHAEQELFECWTCRVYLGRCICVVCARKCHRGHDVVPCSAGGGYCDCAFLCSCAFNE